MNFKNKILHSETIEMMKKLPDKSFDFCFADPPYFMQIAEGKKLYRVEGSEFNGVDDDWDKFESMEKYKAFTKSWLTEVRRLLKTNGTICVISGMQSIFEIGSILRDLGFWVINDIIWKKSNPTPNFSGSRLNNSHETMIWASKSKKSKFTFNYKTGKALNNGKQMGSIWEFPVCSGSERLKDDENKKLHNTQKPESLLHRIITLFTKKGDLILDPFGGTMTTAAVAKKTGRTYTMIEQDENYIKYGQKRLDNVMEEIGDIENAIFDNKPLKVSMAEMVQNGFFIIGEEFHHKNGETAILSDNRGYLKYKDTVESMHEVAAKMGNNKRRVNAFDFLLVKRNGKLVSISEVRENYRQYIKSSSLFLS
ncbi:site-specific DNA-methyltransferase [Mycoplasmopsis agassizii]|uniref:DNA-methyltransferase n=1 Tax=Mycoplasmopsis agassizii TaxID=33922 RepID=UPI003527E6C7